MIELEQPPHQNKLTPVFNSKFLSAGLLIAIVIVSIWAVSLGFLISVDISHFNFLLLIVLILWQTFLYTGLFITCHDAMHGSVCPSNPKINHFIGKLCISLYGLLPYQILLKKHWLHHHNPASDLDPDFHDGKHKNFFAWYFHFMKNYWSWRQIIAVTIVYQSLNLLFHIPRINLNCFWVIPSLLSSLQLFYFGTFIPHTQPVGGYIQPHKAQTIKRPTWWSFITCYHFGYHEEHHEFPHIAWWQLPKVYKMGKNFS
ncbi:MAG: beta-carotene ketolase CrtW [Aulosira sp. ZfuVER01]|nr:fatty acid desaturase [Aulosira sp. ZfuVER01]MDZ7999309.1 fatty acid desaturase [Aulosira sp. DedVER01a]MDZ8051910.1 fatty acid desaturase [Aulosira sp. ZfuCHP01]